MFSRLLDSIKREVVSILSQVQVRGAEEMVREAPPPMEFEFKHEEFQGFGLAEGAEPEAEGASGERGQPPEQPFVRGERKIGRNEPCPCGSGRKYKYCHGRVA
jgi:preprotein translocase subunit SecA